MKEYLINIATFFLKFLVQKMPPAVVEKTKEIWLSKLDEYSNSFHSITSRPIFIEKVNKKSKGSIPLVNFAIVIQGPILKDKFYTLNTIKLYLETYQCCEIILSTWEGEEIDNLPTDNKRFHLILNTKPEVFGPNNLNLQLKSTIAGLNKAKTLECEYVLKTRTDQRIYNKSLFDYLVSLQKQFKIDKEKYSNILDERLIALSFTTLKYRPFGIGDMFMFGRIKDMINYWDLPYNYNLLPESIDNMSIEEHAKLKLGEVYIMTSFLDKYSLNYKFDLEDTWKYYREIFVIADHTNINLHWYKYDYIKEDRFNYYEEHTFQLANFNDWLFSFVYERTPFSLNESKCLKAKFGAKI